MKFFEDILLVMLCVLLALLIAALSILIYKDIYHSSEPTSGFICTEHKHKWNCESLPEVKK